MAPFTADVEVIEWMGSELYAYFTVQAEETRDELQDLAEDLGMAEFGSEGPQMVARLDAGSQAAEGKGVDLCLDIDRIHLFDAKTGENIQNPTGHTGEVPAVRAG